MKKVENCFLKTQCIGLREIQVFVATNLKSHFLVEEGGSNIFQKATFIMAFR